METSETNYPIDLSQPVLLSIVFNVSLKNLSLVKSALVDLLVKFRSEDAVCLILGSQQSEILSIPEAISYVADSFSLETPNFANSIIALMNYAGAVDATKLIISLSDDPQWFSSYGIKKAERINNAERFNYVFYHIGIGFCPLTGYKVDLVNLKDDLFKLFLMENDVSNNLA